MYFMNVFQVKFGLDLYFVIKQDNKFIDSPRIQPKNALLLSNMLIKSYNQRISNPTILFDGVLFQPLSSSNCI